MKRRLLGMALFAGLLGVVGVETQARGRHGGGSSSHKSHGGGKSSHRHSRPSYSGGSGGGGEGGGEGGGGSRGGCGSRGGPGYRKDNGKCASHQD